MRSPEELNTALENVHRAGMPGVFAEVRDGDEVWRGAAGVADVATGRPVTADMRHRVGSITKTFTAAAVLQQVERRSDRSRRADRPLPAAAGSRRTRRRDHGPDADQPHQRPRRLPPVRLPLPQAFPPWRTRRRRAWTTTGSPGSSPIELIEMGRRRTRRRRRRAALRGCTPTPTTCSSASSWSR